MIIPGRPGVQCAFNDPRGSRRLLPRSEGIGFFRDGRLDQARLREKRPIAVLCLSEAMTI
jgi:hypothetical protein